MKKLLLSTALLLCTWSIFAQGYYIIPSKGTTAPYSLNPTTPTTIISGATSTTNVLSAAQTLPFANWQFYGQTVTQFKASSSGYITFDLTQTTDNTSNVALPSASAPKNAIFAFWDNLILLNYASGGSTFPSDVTSSTYGTSPNREFVIQWRLAQGGVAGVTNVTYFAIRLHEAGGFDIIENYGFGSFTATIGCQDATGTNGVQVTGSPNLNFGGANGSYDATASDVYSFMPGSQPTNDINNLQINLANDLVLTQAPFVISTNIRNLGSASISSVTLNYSVNGGATVSSPLTGLAIASFATSTISSATNWTPSTTGTYTIKVWTSMPNGSVDGNPANDTASIQVGVWSSSVQKKVLHEIFTSSTCPPCNPGNTTLDGVLATRLGEWNIIKYQVNFPGTGDPYFTSEGGTRFNYYSANFAPWLVVDGNNSWGAADANANSYTTTFFDNRATYPAFMNIAASHSIINNTFTVSGTVTPLHGITNPNLKLRIAIIERSTVRNVKTNGETVFYNVMKKMLPDATGTAINLSAGTAVTFNQTYTFPGSYRLPSDGQSGNIINLSTENSVEIFGNLMAVIFVQDETTHEILQSGSSAAVFALGTPTVSNDNKNIKLDVYPNPSTGGSTSVDFTLANDDQVSIEVYDIIGQKKISINLGNLSLGDHTANFNTSELNNGMYILNLKTTQGVSSYKFMVTK